MFLLGRRWAATNGEQHRRVLILVQVKPSKVEAPPTISALCLLLQLRTHVLDDKATARLLATSDGETGRRESYEFRCAKWQKSRYCR